LAQAEQMGEAARCGDDKRKREGEARETTSWG
jgi:hypothetical protein